MKRRDFLKIIPGLGLTIGLPQPFITKSKPDNQKIINALQQATEEFYNLDEVENDNRSFTRELSRQNIIYAVNKINPTTHNDMAFIVAVKSALYSSNLIVDEYAYRKTTGKSNPPDHPLLHLNKWKVPYTFRLISFQEQITCVIGELTGVYGYENEKISAIIWHNIMKAGSFHPLFTPEYKKRLTIKDAQQILDGLTYILSAILPFAECSTIVSRAMEIMNA